MDAQIRKSLRAVVSYLYDDEEQDYQEQDHPADHIFVHVKRLREFLDSTKRDGR
jgi:hypothetical protein